jgi:Rrf2 family iron-sulfur cluster assembly transcriptional regulator
MISNKSQYGVKALVHLATSQKGKQVGLNEVAEAEQIPLRYLEHIFSRLKANHIVNSVRGAGGGYLLAKSPEKITLAEVVAACDSDDVFQLEADGDRGPGPAGQVEAAFNKIVNEELGRLQGNLEAVSLRDLMKAAGLSSEMYWI